MAAENFASIFFIPAKATGGEVIKIPDDNKEDVMNKYKQEEILMKIDLDEKGG
jgi:hypothetical protein